MQHQHEIVSHQEQKQEAARQAIEGLNLESKR